MERDDTLTRSSTATLRDFHTNSQTAITHATPIPPMSTTNTPPTFARPSSLAVDEDFEVSSFEKFISSCILTLSELLSEWFMV